MLVDGVVIPIGNGHVCCAWLSAALYRWRILTLQRNRHIYWYRQVMFRYGLTWVDGLIVWTNKDMIYPYKCFEYVLEICVIRWFRIQVSQDEIISNNKIVDDFGVCIKSLIPMPCALNFVYLMLLGAKNHFHVASFCCMNFAISQFLSYGSEWTS